LQEVRQSKRLSGRLVASKNGVEVRGAFGTFYEGVIDNDGVHA
jgi:hypothetical protein